MVKKEKCNCMYGFGIVGLILSAAGIYMLVSGFLEHTIRYLAGFWNWWAILYYLIGILLFGIGRAYKHMAHGSCSVHGMK